MLDQDSRCVMGCRAKPADAESFSFELLQFGYAGPREDYLIVVSFNCRHQHEVVAHETGLDYGTDIYDGRIAGNQSLGSHLSAAEKDRLHIQPVLFEKSCFFGHPNVALSETKRGVADADPSKLLGEYGFQHTEMNQNTDCDDSKR